MLSGFKRVLLGRPRDVLDPGVFHKVSLAAFLAWVGLGADGLSSSAYGPEEAFKALGAHTHLGLYMALATAATVFIISLAYNQVIELFPTGGGGYRVATSLIGPRAGLVSGAALSLFLRAYSLGGGTYTGIEAVSNNVQTLREPIVRTGKLTMFYMATSLAFTAGGIILLYLLWHAAPVDGQTLNAVVFGSILESFGLGPGFNQIGLSVVLATEAGLLFVAANTGFLGGPRVLSNMAADSWLPHQFRHLSTRLVTQNGIVIMGLAALVIVLWSRGSVDLLVVLYSINVFLTFTLSLLGLCIYWWRARATDRRWLHRLAFSGIGLAVTAGILGVTLIEQFGEGGWVTVVITSLVIFRFLAIHRHNDWVKARLREVDELFRAAPCATCENPTPPAPN